MSTAALKEIGAVRPSVRRVAEEVEAAARAAGHDLSVIWGDDPNSKPEHSAGTALDFMVFTDTEAGPFIADYLWTHRARLHLRWEIWRQRIRSTSPGRPGTWQAMADRGSPTKNRMDHVHANFAVADSVERVMVGQVHLPVGWYHVDPATVSTVLLGLTSPGRTKHERRPRFEVNVRGFVSKAMPGGRRRTWAVTQYDTYYAAEFLKRGRS